MIMQCGEFVQGIKATSLLNHQAYRNFLKQALLGSKERSFTQVLASMPMVGLDSDFERIWHLAGTRHYWIMREANLPPEAWEYNK